MRITADRLRAIENSLGTLNATPVTAIAEDGMPVLRFAPGELLFTDFQCNPNPDDPDDWLFNGYATVRINSLNRAASPASATMASLLSLTEVKLAFRSPNWPLRGRT